MMNEYNYQNQQEMPYPEAVPNEKAEGQMESYISSTSNGVEYKKAIDVYKNYLSKVNSAASAWKTIGVIQIIIGACLIFVGYGIIPIIIGIWNVSTSKKVKASIHQFQSNSYGIISFVDSQFSGVLELLINLFLGTWIGIIASMMDISAQSYGKNHKDILMEVERNGWI